MISGNSAANASELQENLEDMFHRLVVVVIIRSHQSPVHKGLK